MYPFVVITKVKKKKKDIINIFKLEYQFLPFCLTFCYINSQIVILHKCVPGGTVL